MIDHSLALRLTFTLAHSLWISSALAALIWLLCRFAIRSAEWRYGLWLCALIGSITALPVTFLLMSGNIISASPMTPSSQSIPVLTSVLPNTQTEPSVTPMTPSAPLSVPLTESRNNRLKHPTPHFTLKGKVYWPEWLVICWVMGMLFMSMRLALSLKRGHLLRRDSQPIDDAELVSLFHNCMLRLQLKQKLSLVWSDRITVPALVGFMRPVILLPVSISCGLSTRQLESLLLHEMIHLKRHDSWVNLLQLIVESICFYNPAIWLISRNLRSEREYCCDDTVIKTGSVEAMDYADALLLIAEQSTQRELTPTTLLGAALKRISQLGKRIDRILTPQHTARPLLPAHPLLALFILVSLITGIVTHSMRASTEIQTTTKSENRDSERQRFLQMLNDQETYVRLTAIDALCETADHSLTPVMIRLLQDANPKIRIQAAYALEEINAPQAVPPLLTALKKATETNEITALMRALSKQKDPRVIKPISQILQRNLELDHNSYRAVARLHDPRISTALLGRFKTNEITDFNLVYLLIEMDERRLIPLLISQLENTDIRREETIHALGRFQAIEAVEPILKNLDSKSERIRRVSISALGEIDDLRAVAPLLKLLQREEDSRNLRTLCTALNQIGDPRALPAIEKLTTHQDRQLRETAKKAMYDLKLGSNQAHRKSGAEAGIKNVREALQQKDDKLVLAAIRYLTKQTEDRKTNLLKPLLKHENEKIQEAAINALIRDRSPAATALLIPLLQIPDPSRTVVLALAERKDRRALPALLKMTQDQNQYTRRAAAEHLHFYGPTTIPVLCKLLKSEDQHTRRAAISSLEKIADETALESLLEYAKDETKDSALQRVVKALGRINNPRSIKYLKSQLNDPQQRFSWIAARSLTRLGWKPKTRKEQIRYLIFTGQSNDETVPRTQAVNGNQIGSFELNVPIQTQMSSGTPEYPETVFLYSIDFRDTNGTLKATLRGGTNSWPSATFRLTARLLDKAGKQIAESHQDIKTPGFIISTILRSPLPKAIINFGQVDLKQIEQFELSFEELPRQQSENLSLSSPVELDFESNQMQPVQLTAKWAQQTVLDTEMITLRPEAQSSSKRFSSYNAKINVKNSGGLNADWRFWIVALDADNKLAGRGSLKLTTTAELNQSKKPEVLSIPIRIWNKTATLQKIRVGLELTKVNTGMKENRITETAEHVIPAAAAPLILDDGTAETHRSIAASGHAVRFQRTPKKRYLEAIQIFASRYGTSKAPQADFRIYLLDEKQKVITDLEFPYALIPRGKLKWHTLRTPSIELPETFYIALAFNPHRTKGIYLGLDDSVAKTDSFTGLPGDGFVPLKTSQNWMIRPSISPQPSEQLGLLRLSDRPVAKTTDPFTGCIEVQSFVGESDGKQSYGGSGPAIEINVKDLIPEEIPLNSLRLKGIQLFASRYGSGYNPETTKLYLLITDQNAATSWSHAFAFDQFGYRAKWVNLVLPKPPLISEFLEQGKLTLGLDPHATQYKGIYFHYAKIPESEPPARGIVPGKRFFNVPTRKWAVRVFLTKQSE